MKHTANLTRALLFLLILSMLLTVFVACKEEIPEEPVGGTNPPAEDNLDPDGYVKDKVPDGLHFKTKFHIFAWEDQIARIRPDEEANDNVSRATVLRNETIEERLDIEFNWTTMPGFSSADKSSFALAVESDVDNDHQYDLVVAYNRVPYRLSYKGVLANLAETKYIDLTSPWWPQEYLENMLYRDSIYALVDNASVGTLSNLSCIFFNNTMLEAKKIQSPYDLVESNQWTLATLRELTKDTYEDTNNNDRKDPADTFGIATSTYARVTGWYYGAGIRFSEINDAGALVMTGNDTEHVSKVITAISDLFSSPDGLINADDQFAMFEESRAYFFLNILAQAKHIAINEIELNYGVVPVPKYTSEQTRYYTHIPNTHDAWCIPRTAKNMDCSSAVLELMASESYRKVNHVFYEQNIKHRFAPDERLGAMYDLIRESIVFDFVFIHAESSLGADCDNEMRGCIKDPNKNWVDSWGKIGPSVEEKFNALVESYDNLLNSPS